MVGVVLEPKLLIKAYLVWAPGGGVAAGLGAGLAADGFGAVLMTLGACCFVARRHWHVEKKLVRVRVEL
jgi:hypothetical protein